MKPGWQSDLVDTIHIIEAMASWISQLTQVGTPPGNMGSILPEELTTSTPKRDASHTHARHTWMNSLTDGCKSSEKGENANFLFMLRSIKKGRQHLKQNSLDDRS